MKKFITVLTAMVFTLSLLAQTPQKLSYQAVIRNSSGTLITASPIGMRVSILQGSASGSSVYVETHTPNTNTNGLVSVEIGSGTIVSGSFSAINWSAGPYFIKTETDPAGGTAYSIIGTSELLSVPYALHAKTAESVSGGITENDPVFLASPANGISTTDITNWNNKLSSEVDGSITNEIQVLTRSNDTIYLSNGGYVKLPAGFDGNYNSLSNKPTNVSSFTNDAGYLTSFTEVDGSVTNELQLLTRSNDTIYLSNGGYVKLPAGFDGNYNSLSNKPTNVSSFTNDAGYLTSFTEVDGSVTNELQLLTRSNDTLYLSNGGFVKLPATNAWSLSGNSGTNPNSNFIGTTDDVSLNFRINNFNSGKIERQTNTTYLGYNSGNSTNSGHENTSFGSNTLSSLITGWGNSALGFDVLKNSTTGLFNTGMGYIALNTMTTGRYNTGVGSWALQQNTIGESNAAFGMFSIPFNQTGNYNTSIGAYSGYNATGTGNVFLGYQSGYNENGSNKLHIANSNATTPLIYGDFSSGKIGLGTTSPTFKLEVTEDASFNGVRVGKGNGNISTNTSVGFSTLNSNTSGANNTAVGYKALQLNTNGGQNTAVGDNALAHNTTAIGNTSIGYASLAETTTGNFNSAMGYDALLYNTTGENNTALGAWAMHFNTIGKWNTALGYSSLQKNISGNNNTSIGQEAGFNNTSGNGNVFLGYKAGYNETGSNKLYIANSNTTTPLIYGDFSSGKIGLGTMTPTFKLEVTEDASFNGVRVGQGNGNISSNTAVGLNALSSITNGSWNTALGEQAMSMNTTGYNNTALGRHTLLSMVTGINNTAVGASSLWKNNGGNHNTSLGAGSMLVNTTGNNNTSVGTSALYNNINGNSNTVIGFEAGFNNTGSDNVFIGKQAGYSETGSNKLYIANSNSASPLIYGDFVSANIGLGTITPAAKFHMVNAGTSFGGYFQNTNQANTLNPLFASTNGPAAAVSAANSCSTAAAIRDGVYSIVTGSGSAGTTNRAGYFSATGAANNYACIFDQGNVGIGTTTPAAKLEVNGAVKITGGTASQFLKADGSLDNTTYLTAIIEVADEFSATASQTSFTLTQAPSVNSKVKMYVNGIRISNAAYSVTGTTLTYVPANNGSYALTAGDRIQFDYSY